MSEEKSEKTHKLEHDRPNCIGCGACVAVAPDFWEMDDDGKANIIKGKRKPDETEEKEISEKDFKVNMEAAESCPVNVIHIKRLKDDEKLI
ncbi:ferredoxin [Candidatus Woesearchaeota archaeon CG10_big_fil_rev_8_21_14_0_10_32_9]|nr:MAG: ferredoxin [Candidatus Woesearchaeota archaeon CG10_big_fil_rev_8_21_14_0_10_32_9]